MGILNKSLSERLQLDPELTLEKARKMVRKREAVQEQQQVLSGAMTSSLNEVRPSLAKLSIIRCTNISLQSPTKTENT